MSIKRIILALGFYTLIATAIFVGYKGAVKTNDGLNLLDNKIVEVDKVKTEATNTLKTLHTKVETLKTEQSQAEQEKAALQAELNAEKDAE